MKKLLYTFAFVALLSACTADLEEQQVAIAENNSVEAKILNDSNGCVEGAIIVRFVPSAESRLAECATRAGATRTGVSGVDALLDEVGGYSVEPLYVVTEKNREKVYAGGYHLWYELRFDKSSNMESVATRLAKVGEIERVQYVRRVVRVGKPKVLTSAAAKTASDATRAREITKIPFNDPRAKYQWGLDNQGTMSQVQSGYSKLPEVVAGADINVAPAWKLCAGDPSIVVAVVDEGVMYSHEDLKNNMWVNKAELNGTSGVDDDGNGYKDDIYGFNFVTLTGEITYTSAYDTGHGTHVAGIIAAENNNGIGVCGIAGGSGKGDGVKVMPIQIFSGEDSATTKGMVRAIQYAADNGAHVLQNSWGYYSAETEDCDYWELGPANDKEYKQQLSSEAGAIDYFVKYGGGGESSPIAGGLVIFAAGNEEAGLSAYPAAYKPCVSVAAFNPALRPTYYTNYGPGTDIVAPGGESLYTNGEILSTVPPLPNYNGGVYYSWMQGTSQACPHVSGVAALGLSYAKKLGKRYTADEFRSLLLSATNDITPYLVGSFSYGLDINLNYPDFKGQLGAGYIDAYKLLLQIDGTPCKVVKAGEECQVDLSTYFGTGVANAQFVSAEASAEDKSAVGLTIGAYANGKLQIKCDKTGVATISVTMLVGGGSLNDSSKPYPVETTQKFVVISKEAVSHNGGWL